MYVCMYVCTLLGSDSELQSNATITASSTNKGIWPSWASWQSPWTTNSPHWWKYWLYWWLSARERKRTTETEDSAAAAKDRQWEDQEISEWVIGSAHSSKSPMLILRIFRAMVVPCSRSQQHTPSLLILSITAASVVQIVHTSIYFYSFYVR